jgi:hypothetical protein
MVPWPRPERLVPPRLLEALAALQAGNLQKAVDLCTDADASDPLTVDIVRLVRARAALERRDHGKARRELRDLATSEDPALAALAVQALVEDLAASRRFAAAGRLLRATEGRLRHDASLAFWARSQALAVELQRRGQLPESAVTTLERRLDRKHPPALHAAVHLLRAERAVLEGEIVTAVVAAGEARPHVRTSGDASLVRRQETLARLLRAPFVDVEDWEEPRRTVSREELAGLETRPWMIWVDVLHRSIRRRSGKRSIETVRFDVASPVWPALEALLQSPHRRLGWSQVATAMDLGETQAARTRAERLARDLRAAGLPLRIGAAGLGLEVERFVALFPTAKLPEIEQRLLARLAASPGAAAAQLEVGDEARRTIVEHLARLRRAGWVRMVGGGREVRYYLV